MSTILGYQCKDLAGLSLSAIIPKVMVNLHEERVKNFVETSKRNIMDKERLLFPLNSEGYVVPSWFILKVNPEISKGVQLIGCFS